jgi:SAM-dependent methyltransferase
MADDQENTRPAASLAFGPEDAKIINDFLKTSSHQIFKIPDVRVLIAQARLERLDPKDIRVFEGYGEEVVENTLEHNLGALKKAIAFDRPSLLINPLCNIQYVQYNQQSLKVLAVGPRSEAEIFDLIASGFLQENIRGLDLISYSDFVDLGDMHAMPYGDDSFDVIILGWVLGYSRDIPKAASEILRVARPNAVIALGCQYTPESNEAVEKTLGYKLDGTRFETAHDLLAPFDGHIGQVYFRHDVHETLRHRNGDVMAIFQLAGS